MAGLLVGEQLGSIPSNGQVQQLGDGMTPPRIKRTTRFHQHCDFIMDTGEGELEPCEAEAEYGIYFGDNKRVKMVSLCQFHTIYQESLWRGGEE